MSNYYSLFRNSNIIAGSGLTKSNMALSKKSKISNFLKHRGCLQYIYIRGRAVWLFPSYLQF